MGMLAICLPSAAGVLPEERFDALYHSYDGGGIEINGPSILLRKQAGKHASVSGNYYVDAITSASIDAVTQGSPYQERRTEKTLGVDYLHDKTTLSTALTASDENDYTARSAHIGLAQDVFGDLTTINMGYSRGWDEVGKRDDASFAKAVDRRQFRLGVSQIVTRNLLLNLGYEAITDEGYLNNPYRSYRYKDGSGGALYALEEGKYPETRTSHAAAIRWMYYLPYRAALRGEGRLYNDTWGISARSAEIGYVHPARNGWIFDLRYRLYQQDRADFYRDLFEFKDEFNFMARDKELSTFTSQTLGLKVSYEFAGGSMRWIDKGSLNLALDHIRFEYEDYRDARASQLWGTAAAGNEPLYEFSANIMQMYLSIWY